MILHRVTDIPVDSDWCDSEEISEWDIEELEKLGIEEAWYWYGSGSYEGSGQILMKKDGKFDLHDMGHCSCYGPTENVGFSPHDFDELKSSCSSEYMKEVGVLFDMAGA